MIEHILIRGSLPDERGLYCYCICGGYQNDMNTYYKLEPSYTLGDDFETNTIRILELKNVRSAVVINGSIIPCFCAESECLSTIATWAHHCLLCLSHSCGPSIPLGPVWFRFLGSISLLASGMVDALPQPLPHSPVSSHLPSVSGSSHTGLGWNATPQGMG